MRQAQYENPASARGVAGFPFSEELGGLRQNPQPTPNTVETQGPWAVSRDYERRANSLARAACSMRGPERFRAMALASVLASAARDAALMAGGAR